MKTYTIQSVSGVPDWNTIPALQVDNHLWLPSEQIQMTAQIAYNAEALYVRMCAVEPDIRAEYTAPLSHVCEDSCMEFFFCPAPDFHRPVVLVQ